MAMNLTAGLIDEYDLSISYTHNFGVSCGYTCNSSNSNGKNLKPLAAILIVFGVARPMTDTSLPFSAMQ